MTMLDAARRLAPNRLEAVDACGLDGAAPRDELDALIQAAAFAFGAKTAVLSIVAERRVWFLAREGMDACDAPPELSLCTRVVDAAAPFIVLNAAIDPDLADHPFVTGAPFIRFYAGAPFFDDTGAIIGSLAVIDDQPRFRFTAEDLAAMKTFSKLATHLTTRRIRSDQAA